MTNQTDNNLTEYSLRKAEIGLGTVIKRALPNRHKRMIGAWCFLDHAGPSHFPAGEGLSVGPHPHMGLQTFTWMISGTLMHTDSLGHKQLICPGQVNLMTAGFGISHTEVSPPTETDMHAAQLWIALPDSQRNMPAKFQHYPDLPKIQHDHIEMTLLVGEYAGFMSPVEVYTPLVGLDLATASQPSQTSITLNAGFEYAFLALDGEAQVNGHKLDSDNMLVLESGQQEISIELKANSRMLIIGGEPFTEDVLLWWNFVGRTQEEMQLAREQWLQQDERFGSIADYPGDRLIAPPLPEKMRASK